MAPLLRRSRRSSNKSPSQSSKLTATGRRKTVRVKVNQQKQSNAALEISGVGRRGRKKKPTKTHNETALNLSAPSQEQPEAVTARAQRSLRRQAQMDESTPQPSTRRHQNSKRHSKTNSINKPSNTKTNTNSEDEEVVKVKLNTGTLYMYRGTNRRVVFVRRV